MKKFAAVLIVLALLACALIPSVGFTEDRDTVLLARTLYALGKNESYATKLALGTVVMNRLENNWFADSLGEVLNDQQQFPAGSRYDDESLRAALDSGKLAAFGADVSTVEPIPADNPLLGCDKVIFTPHFAWATFEARTRLMDIAVKNAQAFISGKPVNVVS